MMLWGAMLSTAIQKDALLIAQNGEVKNATEMSARISPPVKSSYKNQRYEWDALISQVHANKSSSNAEVYSYIMAMIEGLPDSGITDSEDAALAGVSVCSAGFFQIAASKSESLVASIDVNGRGFCNNVELIYRNDDGIVLQEIDAWEVDNVTEIVHDIDKDSQNFLVVPTAYSGYDGANCIATWNRIYALQSGTLVDRSRSFEAYYKERLQELLGTDMQRAKARDKDDGGHSVICIQMEADKIERFTGMSPSAGEEEATNWMKSTDSALRLKGITVLADIGDKRSVTALQQASEDSDSLIAGSAKRALAILMRR
jgi:hypothetical protein